MKRLPGHWKPMQSWFSVRVPEHNCPPYCGAGFVHDLLLVCIPVPQDTLHVLHSDQFVNPPSTRTTINLIGFVFSA